MSTAHVGAPDPEIVDLERRLRRAQLDAKELRVRSVGTECALVSLRARLSVEVGGALVSGVYRYTRVWAREVDGQWRVVGGHVSALPD